MRSDLTRRLLAASGIIVAGVAALRCQSTPEAAQTPPVLRSPPLAVAAGDPSGGAPPESTWLDCVSVLHVTVNRGHQVANARRFGEDTPSLRTSARIADLSPTDLRAFCDWEACIRNFGYGHTCRPNDAGIERCRVCDAAGCNGDPLAQADCVGSAGGRATCHVGLLQECTLQQALRGPSDPHVTRTCALSAQACQGSLPGDLTPESLAAQHETDQVTIEECHAEVALASQLEPDAATVPYWRSQLALWDGGLPLDESADAAGDF